MCAIYFSMLSLDLRRLPSFLGLLTHNYHLMFLYVLVKGMIGSGTHCFETKRMSKSGCSSFDLVANHLCFGLDHCGIYVVSWSVLCFPFLSLFVNLLTSLSDIFSHCSKLFLCLNASSSRVCKEKNSVDQHSNFPAKFSTE